MLYLHDLPITEITYTFVSSDTGEPTHIAVSTMMQFIKRDGRLKPALCQLGDTLVAALERGDLGVEEEHALKLADEALDEPLVVGCWGDTDHVIIDGAHRLWRRWQRGDTHFMAYYLPEPVWRCFTILDMPGDGAYWDHFNRNVKVR